MRVRVAWGVCAVCAVSVVLTVACGDDTGAMDGGGGAIDGGTMRPRDGAASDATVSMDGSVVLDDGGTSDIDGGTIDPGPVTHGRDISLANTGPLAWRGPAGETCTEAAMTVYETRVDTSSLGGAATCAWFKRGIRVDAPVTLTACRIDAPVVNGTSDAITLAYCTVDSTEPGDFALGYGNFSATRTQLLGSSDGVRFGNSNADELVECFIRTREQSPEDHNDGIQMYGASGGGVMLRNNIDARPVGGGGNANGALFIADGATGEYEIRDNYFAGGGYSLRLHEAGYYRVTGNVVETGSYAFGPVLTTAAIPGAFLEWADNTETSGAVLAP